MKSMSKIVNAVSRHTGVETLHFYTRGKRSQAIGDARALAFLIAVKYCKYSAAQVGRELKKHHTTVLTAVVRIQGLMSEREYLSDQLSLSLMSLGIIDNEPFERRIPPDDLLLRLQECAA